jgi:hypothetical protein
VAILIILYDIGQHWGDIGAILGNIGVILGDIGAILGDIGQYWVILSDVGQ